MPTSVEVREAIRRKVERMSDLGRPAYGSSVRNAVKSPRIATGLSNCSASCSIGRRAMPCAMRSIFPYSKSRASAMWLGRSRKAM
jgi:hypothetical protein